MNDDIDHIQRQITLAILAHYFFNHRSGVITVSALLYAERPQRCQRHVTCKIGVSIQDLLDRRSGEKVVVQFATFSAEPDTVLRQSAKIEIAAIAVVEKDPVRASLV